MKNLKMLIIVLLTSAVSFLYANSEVDQLNVDIKAIPGTQKVSVSMEGLKGETVIQLKDENKVTLLQQVTTDQKVIKILDLSALIEGEYSLLLTTGHREIVQPILMEKNQVSAPKELRKVFFSPVVRVKGSSVDVSWFNGKIADMKVRITDLNGSIIYSEDINNIVKVEKRYNLEKVMRGDYVIVIDTPRKTYYENVSIK
jgi:hypothetical protein